MIGLHAKKSVRLLALPLAIAAASCSTGEDDAANDAAGAQTTNGTIAAALSEDGDFARVSQVLSETGVAGVFDGAGTYTVLAPTDNALEGLDLAEDGVSEEERRVILIALLRQHILPGQLTVENIREGVSQSGGEVEMRTLGDSLVTFVEDEGDIVVRSESGQSGTLGASVIQASNGTIIPVDAPLAEITAP